MKVFVCNDFIGHYPVGTAAVIVAEDEKSARVQLNAELDQRGLLDSLYHYTLQELDTSEPQVEILCDGNY